MSEMTIEPGRRVTLHFALKLADGAVVDSTFDKAPATFEIGDGNLPGGFEQALYGLQPGQRSTLRILPEQGFGQRNPNNIQKLARSSFAADMALEPGLVVSFADPKQGELPGVVQSFDEDQVVVDFNHPLAGKELLFDVEILSVA